LALTRYRSFSGVRFRTRGFRFPLFGLDPDGCLFADKVTLHSKQKKNREQVKE
jgi:hypothetical protein